MVDMQIFELNEWLPLEKLYLAWFDMQQKLTDENKHTQVHQDLCRLSYFPELQAHVVYFSSVLYNHCIDFLTACGQYALK